MFHKIPHSYGFIIKSIKALVPFNTSFLITIAKISENRVTSSPLLLFEKESSLPLCKYRCLHRNLRCWWRRGKVFVSVLNAVLMIIDVKYRFSITNYLRTHVSNCCHFYFIIYRFGFVGCHNTILMLLFLIILIYCVRSANFRECVKLRNSFFA